MEYIEIPKDVCYIINKIKRAGYESFIVGGCVRDSLMGKLPNDWDLTTSAKPQDIIEIFKKTVPTGIKHGTVSVIVNSNLYEVTTYRIDGEYTDRRHPNSIEFSDNIELDLKRRDFTINSMAYNPDKGLIDLFGGYIDLLDKRVKCVGNPGERFNEDPLRMIRAIRFSATLNFNVENNTFSHIKNMANLIESISNERIQVELNKILLSNSSKIDLLNKSNLLKYILPEVSDLETVEQNTPYHIYNVYEHTMFALEVIENELHLKLAVLLHDTGKIMTKSIDKYGIDHFYGHADKSVEIANNVLKRLKYDNKTKNRVLKLIRYHDCDIFVNKKSIKLMLKNLGDVSLFYDLLKVKWADIIAKSPKYIKSVILDLVEIERLLNEILNNKECYSLESLDINGKDLKNLGMVSGKDIGKTLEQLLNIVIENPEINQKEKLIKFIKFCN